MEACPEQLAAAARSSGAAPEWVTADGYTRLPEEMLAELGLRGQGGEVWFLRGVDAWEAWPGEQVEAALCGRRIRSKDPDYRALYFGLLREALAAKRWHDDPEARGAPPLWPRYLAAWVLAGAERDLRLPREELERKVQEG